MKARVPERATVPRLSISSCRPMPTPLSAMVRVSASLSGAIRIANGAPSASQLRPGDRLVAQPVAGIGGVGDQLAQEDVGLGVDRMHHQPKQLSDLGLKRKRLGGGSFRKGIGVCHLSARVCFESRVGRMVWNRIGYSGRAMSRKGFPLLPQPVQHRLDPLMESRGQVFGIRGGRCLASAERRFVPPLRLARMKDISADLGVEAGRSA